MKLWELLDGKKTYLGYAGVQLFGPDNILSAIGEAATAWVTAMQTKDFAPVVHPTLNLAAQLLLLLGVGHKAVKTVNG